MELFHHKTKYDFMGMRKYTAIFSALILVGSAVVLFTKGLNFGLDFTGGTQLEVRFKGVVDLEDVRTELGKDHLSDAKVTQYGSAQDYLIRIPNRVDISEQELGRKVLSSLHTKYPDVDLRRVEFVGSEVGEHLAEQGALAVVVALLATMIYIAMRFEYRFAVSAGLALLHDPICILGYFSLFQIEFDLATLAAILAVIGYSLNDTIVVYDRVRENFRKLRKGTPVEIMNISINETLSRTIMTSALTLMVVVALFVFGGESLHGFSLALMIGIVIGTYSSIYIAGALALKMGLSKADLISSSKKPLDDLP
ncbi:MAG TPA: protein translocase subunit SecF [Gammaproteobacteria bacterium]|nr:protein translocase subunit SecF [Gammaproteobacteria bacterium]